MGDEGKRFRIAKGKMLVCAPGEKPSWREIRLIYDSANEMVGIQAVDDSELRGYCFFVPEASFKETKEKGTPRDGIPPVG